MPSLLACLESCPLYRLDLNHAPSIVLHGVNYIDLVSLAVQEILSNIQDYCPVTFEMNMLVRCHTFGLVPLSFK